ncbi:MAG: hypothetical protein E7554_00765 [Ruminococcaceae bacterium]|nr:hypothetical protein [Oscillospiraceae bacterium]
MSIRQFEPLWGAWRTEEKPLGQGSYGVVYRAWREEFGKKYYAAIKHISIPGSESQIRDAISEGVADTNESLRDYFASITQNLTSEIALMSEVKGHTNIVSYEDHMIIPKPGGIGYDIIIRMELLTGLNDVLRHRQLTNRDVIKLGIDICSALEVCLEKGIIHRDIKPSNIFINDLGNYKLGDFGVARELGRTTIGMSKKGTYMYMAPEVYRGEPASFTADTFSLGIVMYRLLNGNRAPFLPVGNARISSVDNENALARRMSGEPLPAPAFADPGLAQVILKATQFDRSRRFSTPTEFKQALIRVRDGSSAGRTIPIVAAPTNNTPPPVIPPQRMGHMMDMHPAAPMVNDPAARPANMIPPGPVPVSAAPSVPGGNKKKTGWIWGAIAAAVLVAVGIIFLALPGSGADENPSGTYGLSMVCENYDSVYYYNGISVQKMSTDGTSSEALDWFGFQLVPYNNGIISHSFYSIDLLDGSNSRYLADIESIIENGECSSFCVDGNMLYFIIDYETDPNDEVWTDQRSVIYSTNIDTNVTTRLLELNENEYPLWYGDLRCADGCLYFATEQRDDADDGEASSTYVWKYDLQSRRRSILFEFVAADCSDACVFTDTQIVCRSYYYVDVYDYDGNLIRSVELDYPTYGYSFVIDDKFIYGHEYMTEDEVGYYLSSSGIYTVDLSPDDEMRTACIFDGYCDIVGAAGDWIYFIDYKGVVDIDEDPWANPLCRIRTDGTGYMQLP